MLALSGRALRLSAFQAALQAKQFDDVYYYPPAEWLPALSLGYRAALADLLWCRSLVYFGEGVSRRVAVRHVFDYTDALLALDPDFRAPYRWVTTAISFRPAGLDVDEALRAARYVERGVERWPEDGQLRWELGAYLRFDVAPLVPDPARKQAVLERAAPHLAAAARLGAGPAWLALTSSSLLERLGQTQQALKHLEEMHALVGDDQVRAEIAARIAALRASVGIPAGAGP